MLWSIKMKKLALVLGLFLSLGANAWADSITFLHPIFYQQLSGQKGEYFYVLKPNSIYYENAKTGVTQSNDCILQKNQEYFIQMLCSDCNDLKCSSYSLKNHTFTLSQNKTADNYYIISHKVYDEDDNLKSEEMLTNDGLITIPPYQ